MKKNKFLLPIAIIPLMLTSCDNKPFITPSFLNYRGYDVTEAEHDAKLTEANAGLGLSAFDYENTSYSDVLRRETTIERTADYANSKDKHNETSRYESSIKYNHSKSLLSRYLFSDSKVENNQGKTTSKTEQEFVNQIYQKNIVEAYKQQKTYRNMADFTNFPTFAAFVRTYMPVNPLFALTRKIDFQDFVLEDVPTKYYVHDNVFTSGIEYNDRQLNTEDYERTVSVSAVNQIVINKNEVTINTQCEIKDIRTSFTDIYRQATDTNCNKLTISTKVVQVETLKIGGKVSIDSASVGDYSLVSFF